MNEAHEKTRIRQLEDASAHWERKYANARQYNRNLEERIAALEARCVAAEQAEANAFRNRDSAVAENEKFRAMLEKIEGSSRPRGEPAWQYDEIRALLGMPTASETQEEPHGMVTHSSINTKCEKCGEPLLHKNHMFDAQTALNRSVKP